MNSFDVEVKGADVTLRLDGEITIEHAHALHDALRLQLRADRYLIVNAAGLKRLDAAALQVLLSASQAAAAISIIARSDAWDEACRRYAVEHPLRPGSFGTQRGAA